MGKASGPDIPSVAGQGGGNRLLQEVDYKITKTRHGVKREYMYETGHLFSEYKSNARVGSWPLVHITRGVCPSTGRRVAAKGVIAIGRIAIGGIALGQLAVGILPVGHLAIGLAAVGQGALGILFGLGQLGTGYVAIAQMGLGYMVLAQLGIGHAVVAQQGIGEFVFSMGRRDPQALEAWRPLLDLFR